MTSVDEGSRITISENEARGAVTGHNVRYVLIYGLGGLVAAFSAVAIYFGFDRLTKALQSVVARGPVALVEGAVQYLLAIGAVVLGVMILLGLANMLLGRSENATQAGMRARIALQFTLICALMAGLYVAG